MIWISRINIKVLLLQTTNLNFKMNYELISKMTFAELRALEYYLNEVKYERTGWGRGVLMTEWLREGIKETHLKEYSEQDKKSDMAWAKRISDKEFEKTYRPRVEAFDITAVSRLPSMIGNLILEFVGIETSYGQNHFIREKFTNDNNRLCKNVMKLAREKALAIHRTTCLENFGKMKMKKIKELFSSNSSLQTIKMCLRFKMNSKNNFIVDLNNCEFSEKQLLTLLIASTR